VKKALVYWQGHSYTGAGNVQNSVSSLLNGSLFSLFVLPSGMMTDERMSSLFALEASSCRDPTSRAEVLGRTIPALNSGFSEDLQPLLRSFEMALEKPSGTLPAGTRLEVRSFWNSRAITGLDCEDQDDEMDGLLLNSDLIIELACYAAQNVPNLCENLIVLSSDAFYRYIRLCVWKLDCERALAAGILKRNWAQSISSLGNALRVPLILPRSIVFWLLETSIGVAHVAGTLPLSFRERRVHEAFLASGYFANVARFGHPFGRTQERTIMLGQDSPFSGLCSLNMSRLLGSNKFSSPYSLLNLPEYYAATTADLLPEERARLANSYRELMLFSALDATSTQLQFHSIDNPSALHLSAGTGFLDCAEVEEVEDDFFIEVQLISGSAKRANEQYQEQYPRAFSRSFSVTVPMEIWFRRCLLLLGKDVFDLCSSTSREKANLFAKVLAEEPFRSAQHESIFWKSFWDRIVAEEERAEAAKAVRFQGCASFFSDKLVCLFLEWPLTKKSHPWMKCAGIQCFSTQATQFHVESAVPFLILARRCLSAIILLQPFAKTLFAFPVFDAKRRRCDRIWTFLFERDNNKLQKGKKRAKPQAESESSEEEFEWE
jgi:hypothetical protein